MAVGAAVDVEGRAVMYERLVERGNTRLATSRGPISPSGTARPMAESPPPSGVAAEHRSVRRGRSVDRTRGEQPRAMARVIDTTQPLDAIVDARGAPRIAAGQADDHALSPALHRRARRPGKKKVPFR